MKGREEGAARDYEGDGSTGLSFGSLGAVGGGGGLLFSSREPFPKHSKSLQTGEKEEKEETGFHKDSKSSIKTLSSFEQRKRKGAVTGACFCGEERACFSSEGLFFVKASEGFRRLYEGLRRAFFSAFLRAFFGAFMKGF